MANASVTLTYGSRSVILRGPDFDNADSYNFERVNRKTRNGDIKVFRDPNWPIDSIFKYKFTLVRESIVNALVEFLDASFGQDITLLDYEGNTWNGQVITPTPEIVQPSRNSWTVNFDFQIITDAIAVPAEIQLNIAQQQIDARSTQLAINYYMLIFRRAPSPGEIATFLANL